MLHALLRLYPIRLLLLGSVLWETRRVVYAVIKTLFHTNADGLFAEKLLTAAPASFMVTGIFVAVYWLSARVIEHRSITELRLNSDRAFVPARWTISSAETAMPSA